MTLSMSALRSNLQVPWMVPELVLQPVAHWPGPDLHIPAAHKPGLCFHKLSLYSQGSQHCTWRMVGEGACLKISIPCRLCLVDLNPHFTYEKFSPFADTFKKRVSKNTFFVLVRVVDELW